MKKLISILLCAAMLASLLAGCGAKPEETQPTTPKYEGTMEELANKIAAEVPEGIQSTAMTLDLTDTSEEGLWSIKNATGLDSTEDITDAAVYESMIGSIAFSMVTVRVAEGADAQAVAEAMKAGIDPRKWICVSADDVMVAGYGDVVMFIMVDTGLDLTAQSYVDAFASVVGGEPTFTLK